MAALALLLAPRSWFVQNTVSSQRDKRKEVIITGLVEFQKAQCYFAVAVQTAALVYTHQFQSSGGQVRIGVDTNQTDLIDAVFLFTIATNGYIPVVFSLVCISWHGHLTWYIIGLSLSSIALSTSTLVNFYISRTIQSVVPLVPSNIESFGSTNFYTACGGYNVEQLQIWCGPGTSFLKSNWPGHNVVLSGWNWVLWVNCFVWTLYCVIKHTVKTNKSERVKRLFRRISVWWHRSQRRSYFTKGTGASWIWFSLFFSTWSISLGYQLYLYSLYFISDEVANNWSFGQIVGVLIWLPCMVEYVYLAISEYYRLTQHLNPH